MPNFKILSLPNIITLLNLLTGFFAIVYATSGYIALAGLLILIAGLFDFLDGLTARVTQSFSPIGGQLDSLADLVSFGIAPGLISFKLLEQALQPGSNYLAAFSYNSLPFLSVAFIPALSAIRLAKFNTDQRQSESFIGLPTPANALFFASLPFLLNSSDALQYNPELVAYILTGFNIGFSILLILEFPMFSLKFATMKFTPNIIRYAFILLSLALFLLFRMAGLSAIVLLYILLSFVNMFLLPAASD